MQPQEAYPHARLGAKYSVLVLSCTLDPPLVVLWSRVLDALSKFLASCLRDFFRAILTRKEHVFSRHCSPPRPTSPRPRTTSISLPPPPAPFLRLDRSKPQFQISVCTRPTMPRIVAETKLPEINKQPLSLERPSSSPFLKRAPHRHHHRRRNLFSVHVAR